MTGGAAAPAKSPRAVGDAIARMARLADWLQANKPTCKVMTLTRRDFDLLRKHAGAAGIHENNGVVYWRGFELHAQAAPLKSKARV
jgi:hypothetical protein